MITKSPWVLTGIVLASGFSVAYVETAEAQTDASCIARIDMIPVEGRTSPLDSVMFQVAGQDVKICYGRPSARGRTMIGSEGPDGAVNQMGVVPFGQIWRTGANEPTLLRTPVALVIAGVSIPAGTYSLYTVPGPTEWEIVVNRSYSQWGQEGTYTADVQAQEVGRGKVVSGQTDSHVEMFTIRAESPTGNDVSLVLEWERTQVKIPVSAGGN